MGFFDFLFGTKPASNVEILNDRIWMTQKAKFHGIHKELSQSRSSAILLVGHFPDTLRDLETLASRHNGSPVATALAEARDLVSRLNLTQSATLDVIVGERHPLLEIDENLLRLLEELPFRCRLAYHLSLEDPVLKQFAGEWLAGVLANLGMKEDEAIESAMVSRRIKDAQKKIQAEVFGNVRAASAAEWLEKNLPNTSGM